MKSGFVAGGIFQECLPQHLKQNVESPGSMSSDELAMAEAFKASLKSVGICNPNPAVGAAIYKNQHLVSTGFTQTYGQKHAERLAIEAALEKGIELKGSDLFVTLEPCSHHGKQPPCADLVSTIAWNRIVVGSRDPNPLVNGKGLQKILSVQPELEIVQCVLEKEIRSWNFPFFAQQSLKRPIFIGKWAQSFDGKLARADGTSQWISGETSRAYSHWLRQKYDVVVVGANTLLTDQSRLNVRECGPPIQIQPLRLVFDPQASLISKIPQTEEWKNVLQNGYTFLTQKKNITFVSGFLKTMDASEKCHVVECDSDGPQALLEPLVHQQLGGLRGKPIASFFIEGGSRALSSLLKENLIDLCHIFVSEEKFGKSHHQLESSPLNKKNELLPHWSLLKESSIQRFSETKTDRLLEIISKSHLKIF